MTDTTRPLDLETITFARGAHGPGVEMCVMECVAYIAGEPWSDAPQCVSPVIAAFARSWYDALDEPPSTQLLRPLVREMIGTRTTAEDEETRTWMAIDWLARVHTPAWLRLAGLTTHAEALEACARIADATTAGLAQPSLDAAESVAWSAARSAARSAAWSAAGSAAWSAAGWAAGSAARSAAWSAAGSAVESALAPTVELLQASAVDLLRAMCAVGRESA